MGSIGDRTHVFIVRMWCEPREIENALPVWRCSVESVATGHRRYVRELAQIPAAIAACLREFEPPSARGAPGGEGGPDEGGGRLER